MWNPSFLRTGPTITSQKRVKDEKIYKPHFLLNSELSLEKVGEFRLNPGSRTKFTNPAWFCDAMVGPLLKISAVEKKLRTWYVSL